MKKAYQWVISIMKQLQSTEFVLSHKTAPKHFTRESPLNFANTLMIILNLIKKPAKVEVMKFFENFDSMVNSPSRQAFSQAREKISYTALEGFFLESCNIAANDPEAETFGGYRLFAVDGTSFVAGKMEKLKSYFGESTTVPGKAMCRISGIVDVINGYIVNAKVAPFHTGERALAIQQIGELASISNALFLFDRGYWSRDIVKTIMAQGQRFLMRLASNAIPSIPPNGSGLIMIEGYQLRYYSFKLSRGATETLLTNMPESEMPDEELAALYAKRWGVETKYLELKERLQIDRFSGESLNIVLQDIFSTLCISNLVAFICWDADRKIAEKPGATSNRYKQKANRAICIAALRCRLISICLMTDGESVGLALERLTNEIARNVTYTGKSASRPRSKHRSNKPHRLSANSFL